MKERTYYYPICDCEHEGDIRRAENEVTNAGGQVIRSVWDGEDCGDAYVVFKPKHGVSIESIAEKLGDEIY